MLFKIRTIREAAQPHHKPKYAGNALFHWVEKSRAKYHYDVAMQCFVYSMLGENGQFLGEGKKYLEKFIKEMKTLHDEKERKFVNDPVKLKHARAEYAKAMKDAYKMQTDYMTLSLALESEKFDRRMGR